LASINDPDFNRRTQNQSIQRWWKWSCRYVSDPERHWIDRFLRFRQRRHIRIVIEPAENPLKPSAGNGFSRRKSAAAWKILRAGRVCMKMKAAGMDVETVEMGRTASVSGRPFGIGGAWGKPAGTDGENCLQAPPFFPR
jgi:hypothetical protein